MTGAAAGHTLPRPMRAVELLFAAAAVSCHERMSLPGVSGARA
jgi:hypothetical protein